MSAAPMGAWLRWLPLAVLALRRATRLAPHPIGTTSISQFILVGYLRSEIRWHFPLKKPRNVAVAGLLYRR